MKPILHCGLRIGDWRLFLIGVALLAMSAAEAVTVGWDASAGASGYRVYHGRTSRSYTNSVDVGSATEASIPLPRGTNFIAVKAYAGTIESDFSAELMVVQPLSLLIESSADLSGPWAIEFRGFVTNGGGQKFFRVTLGGAP